jgi:hypothetical protein
MSETAYQGGPIRPLQDTGLSYLDVEVSFGIPWVSLNDHVNYTMAVEGFGEHSYQRRRTTATSPYYDGTFLVHSTLENVTEAMSVYVLGTSANHVTENLMLLEEVFSQDAYSLRITMDDHRETWSCMTADYSIDRGHVNMHNNRATMKLSIPRLPRVSYEVSL